MKKQTDKFVGGHEGLRILAHRLIDWQDVPGVFRWHYGRILVEDKEHECGSVGCAIGFVGHFWTTTLPTSIYDDEEMAEAFGIPENIYQDLFYNPETYGKDAFIQVTARMVGEKILQYLDTGSLD